MLLMILEFVTEDGDDAMLFVVSLFRGLYQRIVELEVERLHRPVVKTDCVNIAADLMGVFFKRLETQDRHEALLRTYT